MKKGDKGNAFMRQSVLSNPVGSTHDSARKSMAPSKEQGLVQRARAGSIFHPASAVDITGLRQDAQGFASNKIEMIKRTQFNIRKVTQLCSFIPDFILMDEVSRKIPYQFSYDAVVLMADISGFTALTEVRSLST